MHDRIKTAIFTKESIEREIANAKISILAALVDTSIPLKKRLEFWITLPVYLTNIHSWIWRPDEEDASQEVKDIWKNIKEYIFEDLQKYDTYYFDLLAEDYLYGLDGNNFNYYVNVSLQDMEILLEYLLSKNMRGFVFVW